MLDILADARYWLSIISIGLFCVCFNLLKKNSENFIWKTALLTLASFSIVTLIFSLRSFIYIILVERSGGADSALALGLFSIVATFASGYVLIAGQKFEKRRAELEQKVQEATNLSKHLDEVSKKQEDRIDHTSRQLDFSDLKLRAFLHLYGCMKKIDKNDDSINQDEFFDLALLESLLFRTDIKLTCFDLKEMLGILKANNERFSKSIDYQIVDYLKSITDKFSTENKHSELDIAKVQDLIDSFLREIRLNQA